MNTTVIPFENLYSAFGPSGHVTCGDVLDILPDVEPAAAGRKSDIRKRYENLAFSPASSGMRSKLDLSALSSGRTRRMSKGDEGAAKKNFNINALREAVRGD
eukprot:1346783-Amorphochlora_amoeboformis.AAC.1